MLHTPISFHQPKSVRVPRDRKGVLLQRSGLKRVEIVERVTKKNIVLCVALNHLNVVLFVTESAATFFPPPCPPPPPAAHRAAYESHPPPIAHRPITSIAPIKIDRRR